MPKFSSDDEIASKIIFSEDSLDDLLRFVLIEIKKNGKAIKPSRGEALEIMGATLQLNKPRARISCTESRGKLFSCLGELCWYLWGNNTLDLISYYIPDYRDNADDGIIFGGYGPRLFNWGGLNQFNNVLNLLERRKDTRQAVIQLFDKGDILKKHKDVPCTCVIQFLKRDRFLYMITFMRSNDIYLGLPHDLFSFTMLQEIVALSLDLNLGSYTHIVGSLHLYKDNIDKLDTFLEEGWQSKNNLMPEMPEGNPWPSIKKLLEAERKLRLGDLIDFDEYLMNLKLENYWVDLIKILQIFRYKKDKNFSMINSINKTISCDVYKKYIDNVLRLQK